MGKKKPKPKPQSKPKSKKSANCCYYFPTALLGEVLARLPVKTLLKLRCVCKEWQSLIDSPGFASLHLNFQEFNREIADLFLIDGKHDNLQCSIRSSDTFRKTGKIDLPSDFCALGVMMYLNGLFLWNKFHPTMSISGFNLWNPSIRKSVEIPPPPSSDNPREMRVGFGYDAVATDYKLVVIVCRETPFRDCPPPKTRDFPFPILIDVYSLKTRSWRSSSNATRCVRSLRFDDTTVFMNKAIHWIGCDVSMVPYQVYGSHVIAFDVQNEVLNYFALPDGRAFYRSRLLDVLGKSLVLLDLVPGCSLIWVMEQYGVSESWVKRYTIDLEYDSFLYFKKNCELLVTMKKEGVNVYNIEREEIKGLAKTYRNKVFFLHAFVESLESLTIH